jgi:hypothetical protein
MALKVALIESVNHIMLANNYSMPDRVRVVVAHFVSIRLALNSTFRLNCQQKFNVWAAGRWKYTSSSTLLYLRYVPSLYHATTVAELCAT